MINSSLKESNPKTEEYIQLAKQIIAKHSIEGPQSVIKSHRIAEINFKMNAVSAKHEETLKVYDEINRLQQVADALLKERDTILGTDSLAEEPAYGSLKYYLDLIKQELLEAYAGDEKSLLDWGFVENAPRIETVMVDNL